MRLARNRIPGALTPAPDASPHGQARSALAVAVLCLAGVAVYGSRGSLGLFLPPWQQQFGVSRASVALVSTVGFLVFAAAQPLAGRLLETIPGRRLVVIGLALCGAGFAGAALADSMAAVVVLIGVVAALGTGLASLPVLSVIAADTVRRREGMVFGLLTAAAAGGQVLVLPLATGALQLSVTAALLLIAVLLAVAGVAVAGVAAPGREAGSEKDPLPARTSLPELVREPRFWQLLVPFFICGYTTTGLIDTHLIPHAVDHHIHVSVASSALATLAAFNVAGVLVAGGLTDRMNRGRLLAAIYAARAVVLVLLPVLTTPTLLFVFAALFGLADFATVPPTTALTRQVFRAGGWALAIGLISAAHQLGSALGAFAGGWLFDRTGGYGFAFATAAAALVAASVVSLRLSAER